MDLYRRGAKLSLNPCLHCKIKLLLRTVLLFRCSTKARLSVSSCLSVELSGIRLPPPTSSIPRSGSDTTPTHGSHDPCLQPTRSVVPPHSLVSVVEGVIDGGDLLSFRWRILSKLGTPAYREERVETLYAAIS